MEAGEKSLAQQVADQILSMIAVEQVFLPGDKLPNENQLSAQLQVSRATLREAIRILEGHKVLEIRRGKGTFVVNRPDHQAPIDVEELSKVQIDLQALYELRLMVEPAAARYAALRGTPAEIKRILQFGGQEEELIRRGEDRTQVEQAFHQAIAVAAHNPFVERLMPMIQRAISSGVILSREQQFILDETLTDHRLIMDFIASHDGPGAETAMRLHLLRAMRGFGITPCP